jgi:hypothetical protein
VRIKPLDATGIPRAKRIMFKKSAPALCLSFFTCVALAQGQGATSENGAVSFNLASGWSFGLPANRAIVSVPGGPTAISPEDKTLVAPSFGVGVTVGRYVMPFFELGAYDAGEATASVGQFTSKISGEILTLNGGVRILGSRSRIRPYAVIGGGVLRQKPTFTFTSPIGSTTGSDSTTIGNFMYGGGVQFFGGRRYGMEVGFDGFVAAQEFAQGGRNFSRFRIGFFFQTKSSLP